MQLSKSLRKQVIFVAIACLLFTTSVAADLAATTADIDANTRVSIDSASPFKNLRWAFDQSTRHITSLQGDHSSWQHATGLDVHKVFQNDKGDIGTLVLQPFLVRLTNVKKPPFHFDSGDDWELTWRIVNFNYTALAQGRFNIRVGHFEVPFGLEQNIDTNGTLRQYTFSDRGIKADWGMSVNGILDRFEYEVALTRGSGNKYSTRSDPYLFSGRIGTPASDNLVVGLSALYGETLGATGTTERKIIGVDLAYYLYEWEFLLEVSGGAVNGKERLHLLTEASWRSPMESLHLYTQLRNSNNKNTGDWSNASKISFGLHYDFSRTTSLSAEIAHDIDTVLKGSEKSDLMLQLRVRL